MSSIPEFWLGLCLTIIDEVAYDDIDVLLAIHDVSSVFRSVAEGANVLSICLTDAGPTTLQSDKETNKVSSSLSQPHCEKYFRIDL